MISTEFQSSTVISMMPESLLDIDKTVLTSRHLNLARCSSISKICEQTILEYNRLDQHCSELKRSQKEKTKILKLYIDEMKQNVYSKQNDEKTLRNKILQTKKLLSKKSSAPSEEELCILTTDVLTLKDEIKSKLNTIKSEVEGYQKGILFYKKFLQCNVLTGSQKEHFIFTLDPAAKNESEARHFIQFTTKDAISFQYVNMQPKLKMEKNLVKRFEESGDIQGFILSFWEAVRLMKTKKVLGEKN